MGMYGGYGGYGMRQPVVKKEESKESGKEQGKEPSKEQAKEPGKESAGVPEKEQSKDQSKEETKAESKGSSQEPGKPPSKEEAKGEELEPEPVPVMEPIKHYKPDIDYEKLDIDPEVRKKFEDEIANVLDDADDPDARDKEGKRDIYRIPAYRRREIKEATRITWGWGAADRKSKYKKDEKEKLKTKYRDQLKQLRGFGFRDENVNIEALVRKDGDVEQAMAWMVDIEEKEQENYERLRRGEISEIPRYDEPEEKKGEDKKPEESKPEEKKAEEKKVEENKAEEKKE